MRLTLAFFAAGTTIAKILKRDGWARRPANSGQKRARAQGEGPTSDLNASGANAESDPPPNSISDENAVWHLPVQGSLVLGALRSHFPFQDKPFRLLFSLISLFGSFFVALRPPKRRLASCFELPPGGGGPFFLSWSRQPAGAGALDENGIRERTWGRGGRGIRVCGLVGFKGARRVSVNRPNERVIF
ncbi:hypothetical protein TRVL_02960 [Trypanosoma vivax]|uniref:Uncharacterized protein n=1 Tax=Trypanosoma vivax (strain Y486) TaxID=1055687 RepID=G0U6Z6_TRYVY|nr:hypothetical protein TRVL_02960 [Trypanosoma vivax]CCC51653.1 hypothetical protein TVY486_1007000 [Trypanosoma vivax Y486]